MQRKKRVRGTFDAIELTHMGENVEFSAENENVQRHSAAFDVSIRLTSIFPHGWENIAIFAFERGTQTNTSE
jgi:hypothetical protein